MTQATATAAAQRSALQYEAFQVFLSTSEPPTLDEITRPGTATKRDLDARLDRWMEGCALSRTDQSILRGIALEWHDHHDEAHDYAQNNPTPEGNFLHAMLHRREPDYWNAKYWFRQVGVHPAFIALGRAAEPILKTEGDVSLNRQLMPGGIWEASGFVDAVDQSSKLARSHPRVQLLRRLQAIEFECLVRHILGEVTT